jgi:hypothetical protein
MKNYSFKEKVQIIKKCSESLVSKTFPNCEVGSDVDLAILKSTEVLVGGFHCGLFYSISDFKTYKIKVLQVWPIYHYFLSVDVLTLIIKEFFDCNFFYYFQVWSNEKMFYCWVSVVDERNVTVKNFYNIKKQIYFGDILCYPMEPKEINII